MIEMLPADLIFTRSASLLGALIRWFEKSRGEAPSYTNHTAGVGTMLNVVEALTTVRSTPYEKWFNSENQFEIWRTSDLDDAGREKVAKCAESQIGRKYGVLKLISHALDGLLSKITGGSPYVFRRFLFLKRYPICSWVWSYAYHEASLDFGGSPNRITPDDMLDFCECHPEKWQKIYDNLEAP